MAEQRQQTAPGGKKGGQKKKEDGAQGSSQAHKAGIARSHAGLPLKKLRRVAKANGPDAAKAYASAHGLMAEWRRIEASGLVERRQAASQRRYRALEVRAAARLQAACARHEARRTAEAAAKAAAELKAKYAARAKKAAATRAANKLAAAAAGEEQTATA